MTKSPLIIFIHIPKTAGVTLQRVIERQFKPSELFVFPPYFQKSVDEFMNLSVPRRSQLRFVRGKVWFGVHEILPRPSTHLTLLRDPIERVISHYFYVLRVPEHYLKEDVTSRHMSLEEYVTSGVTTEMDNGQTRQLSGVQDVFNTVPFKGCTREMLESAKRNLVENFTVVGLTEEFDRTLLLLKHAFGWRNVYYFNSNVTPNRPSRSTFPGETLEIIRKHNELDHELYEFARELFKEQVLQKGPEFEQELKDFQQKNQRYGHTWAYLLYLYFGFRKRVLYRKFETLPPDPS